MDSCSLPLKNLTQEGLNAIQVEDCLRNIRKSRIHDKLYDISDVDSIDVGYIPYIKVSYKGGNRGVLITHRVNTKMVIVIEMTKEEFVRKAEEALRIAKY